MSQQASDSDEEALPEDLMEAVASLKTFAGAGSPEILRRGELLRHARRAARNGNQPSGRFGYALLDARRGDP